VRRQPNQSRDPVLLDAEHRPCKVLYPGPEAASARGYFV
jgi:hypothetical protein